MRFLLLPLLLALPLAALSGGQEPFELAGVGRVAGLVGQPRVFVFDANTPEVHAKGHLPGAKYVHYDDFPASTLPADKGATLIFYCKNPH